MYLITQLAKSKLVTNKPLHIDSYTLNRIIIIEI